MKNKVIIDSPYLQTTPTVRGKDAERFLKRMQENHKESPEDRAKRIADYEMLMKIFER